MEGLSIQQPKAIKPITKSPSKYLIKCTKVRLFTGFSTSFLV